MSELSRKRASLLVMVDLDPVPGWGNEPGDWRRLLEHYLTTAAGHYNPEVIEFTPADLEPMKKAEREAGAAEVRAKVEGLLTAYGDESADEFLVYQLRAALTADAPRPTDTDAMTRALAPRGEA